MMFVEPGRHSRREGPPPTKGLTEVGKANFVVMTLLQGIADETKEEFSHLGGPHDANGLGPGDDDIASFAEVRRDLKLNGEFKGRRRRDQSKAIRTQGRTIFVKLSFVSSKILTRIQVQQCQRCLLLYGIQMEEGASSDPHKISFPLFPDTIVT